MWGMGRWLQVGRQCDLMDHAHRHTHTYVCGKVHTSVSGEDVSGLMESDLEIKRVLGQGFQLRSHQPWSWLKL